MDGSFFVITSKDGSSSSGFGYYAENNIVQKYLAKRQATTAVEKKQIDAKQSKSYMGGVELVSRIGASFRWDFDATKGGWVFNTGKQVMNRKKQVPLRLPQQLYEKLAASRVSMSLPWMKMAT